MFRQALRRSPLDNMIAFEVERLYEATSTRDIAITKSIKCKELTPLLFKEGPGVVKLVVVVIITDIINQLAVNGFGKF